MELAIYPESGAPGVMRSGGHSGKTVSARRILQAELDTDYSLKNEDNNALKLIKMALMQLKYGTDEDIALLKKMVFSPDHLIAIRAFRVYADIDKHNALQYANQLLNENADDLEEEVFVFLNRYIRFQLRKRN